MDTLQQLNQAMRYIEQHLTDNIEIQRVAQIAGCSEYHLGRLFSFLAGISLSEYIRRRRLSSAAVDIQQGSTKIIDIALKYGYASPDAFTRAFRSLHGYTPSEARHPDVAVKIFPPMTFQLTIQGGQPMEYRLIKKESFQIVGLFKQVALQYEGVNPEIAAMWSSLIPEIIQELKALSNIEPHGFISASTNFTDGRAEGTQLDHYIGVATTLSVPEKWQMLNVKASTWAIFTVRGKFPDALQNVWARIYTEWFPTMAYEAQPGPEILWNESPDTRLPDYHSEIWIPVRKTQP